MMHSLLQTFCFKAGVINESIYVLLVVDDIQCSDPDIKDGKNDEDNPDAAPYNTCITFLLPSLP